METHRRTVAKAVTYQLMGLVVMTALGWIFTGSAGVGGAMAAISAAIGAAGYVLHEKLWARVPWGRLSIGSISPANAARLLGSDATEPGPPPMTRAPPGAAIPRSA